jgi:hypothetical protein
MLLNPLFFVGKMDICVQLDAKRKEGACDTFFSCTYFSAIISFAIAVIKVDIATKKLTVSFALSFVFN